MKTKKINKKLQFSKVTISNLELGTARGGGDVPLTFTRLTNCEICTHMENCQPDSMTCPALGHTEAGGTCAHIFCEDPMFTMVDTVCVFCM